MAALSKSAFQSVIGAHATLLNRMTSIHEVKIDPRQVVEAVVNPDDLEICARAKELGMRAGHYHSIITLVHDTNHINVDCEVSAPLPIYAMQKNYPMKSEWPFAEKLMAWADSMSEVCDRFRRGEQVLHLLDSICSSPKQVRYLLPGIVTLLKVGNEEELASKLSDTPTGRNIPPLPAGARQAIADYNALIAQASLLPSKHTVGRGLTFNFRKQVETRWIMHAGA